MITKIAGETWKPLKISGHKSVRRKYAISSAGRAASYTDDIIKDGKLLKGSLTSGYRTLNLHLEDGNGTIYLHREIAKLFVKKPSAKHKYVVHLNFKKEDNRQNNLQWCTLQEMADHQQKSPQKLAYKKEQASKSVGLKLNSAKVKSIKEAINNPRRRMTYKQLAAKYNVSEMTLYRIKSGENWSHVK